MRLKDELARVEQAEDLFALLGVGYDVGTLTVHRLQVLRQFGLEVARIDTQEPTPVEGELRELYAGALARAHAHFAAGPPPGQHIFPGVRRGLVGLGPKLTKGGCAP